MGMEKTPLFICFFLLISLILIHFSLTCLAVIEHNITTDQSALLALKARVKSDPYYVLTNWTASVSACDWVGVTCGSQHRRVTALNISHMDIAGEIPPEFGNLTFLDTLDLSRNHFTGTLGVEFSYLRRLRFIGLSYNSFTGEVPSSFAFLPELQQLYLRNNSFTNLNKFLDNLSFNETNLETLDLTYNNLQENIPESIGNILRNLKWLTMAGNQLSGFIPSSIGNMTRLEILDLSRNSIQGVIPKSLTKLPNLQVLDLEFNSLSGSIPFDIFNISELRMLSLAVNNLSGNIPTNIGYFLPTLQQLYLNKNNFHGVLPNSIINCSKLTLLELSDNYRLTGTIPNSIGELRLLQVMNLAGNNFTSNSISSELGFVTSLVNSRFLTELGFAENPHLNGILPRSLGNLSSSLQMFDAAMCQINGRIPDEIGNLSGLVTLYLNGNNLAGSIPMTLNALQNLQRLNLGHNQLSGLVPNILCELKNIGVVRLSHNQLTGSIPECFGDVLSLRGIYLRSNNLTSSIPESIWKLQDLLELDISSNSFNSSISPQIGNLKVATYINLSANHFTDYLPNTFQDMQSLTQFSLSNNRFEGPIPESMGAMLNLIVLDLSDNNLSGTIPTSLEGLTQLEYFNISFNDLSGEIPTEGPFSNFTGQFFTHNYALCGLPKYQVSACKPLKRKTKMKKNSRTKFLILGAAILVFTFLMVIIIIRYRRKNEPLTVPDTFFPARIERFSYHELLLATNKFSESNLLGKGSFGSVYKCAFGDGRIFAVKVLNMQVESATKTFLAECEVLRNLRHKNLTKVITSISNKEEFKALVLEYMPNGSLEKWLHCNENSLSMMQRLNIMIDVASALEYLHHGYATLVVHCDLKPSNILLDENMIAHVSDFGIAKLLGEGESITYTTTLATMGYMAPEYGLEGLVSIRGDVYSYGIILLETFTGKPPTDEIFCGELSIKQWVKDSLPDGISEILDTRLIRSEDKNFTEKMHCVSSILELALSCLENSPSKRMNMQDMVAELKKIEKQFEVLNKEVPK